MTDTTASLPKDGGVPTRLGFFERWLTLWVALCIVGGEATAIAIERVPRQ